MPEFWREIPGGGAVPCTMQEWATYMDNPARIVDQWKTESLLVSTVFLGMDHNWTNMMIAEGEKKQPPLIYETMIFVPGPADSKVKSMHMAQWRYRTREAASEGHARIVAHIKMGLDPSDLELEP